jgi:short-subunit dehydrogenase
MALKTELESKFKIEVLAIEKDLSQRTAPQEVFDEVNSHGIEIEYLINNAGFGGYGNFWERKWEDDSKMIDLNVHALTSLTRLFLPLMVKRGSGRILNTGSTAGFMPGPLQAVYFATKAFVVSFSQAIAQELKGTGVTVTALCPGPVDTGFISAGDLEGTDLFKKTKSADWTATRGYKAMMKGKLLEITEFNFMINWLIPFMPKSFLLGYTQKLQEKH